MSTPKSFTGRRRPASPFQTISLSNRDSSPRAASLARLAQTPTPASPRRSEPGTPEPSSSHQQPPYDFRKIDPSTAGSYGSIGSRRPGPSALSRQDWTPQNLEDPEIIRKHLVSGFDRATTGSQPSTPPPRTSSIDTETSKAVAATGDNTPFSEEFSSLQLQGGDITRQVYRYAEQSGRRSSAHGRSRSFSYPPPRREDGEAGETVQDIMVPGGFRRNFIQRAYTQPVTGDEIRPTFVTRNFLHFLTLYGHFAGEDLEEWEDAVMSGTLCRE